MPVLPDDAANERVSILLPAYNAEATLPLCLRSLQRQTETRWQCILVDDGSSDRTPEIASEWARRDPRITVLQLRHIGLVAALNAGLSHCRGEYVARMDADDWMHSNRLRVQVRMLADDPSLAGVATRVRTFPRQSLTAGWRAYESWLNAMTSADDILREAFVESPVVHPSLMLRRTVMQQFPYRDRGWPEDYDLVLRLLAAGHSLGITPRRMLAWRDHPGRLTRTGAAYSQDSLTKCRATFLADGFLSGTDLYILWGYGGTGRALRRALASHGKHPSHIIEVHPGRIGNRIHGALVMGPEDLRRIPRLPLIASVVGQEARSLIRSALASHGWTEGRDFVCAA